MEPVGHVAALSGSVTAQGTDALRQLKVGDPVFAKDVLSTGAGSTVEIKFVDDSVFSQGPSAKMTVDSYVFD
ncbi:MAG: hypothetical protein AB1916_16355, partial [Thermodesulfobacteriota bacterium]